MLESVVDLTYRGLSLGRRIRLCQVRPSSGYLEIAAPMPVGTHIVITTDDGVAFDATVTSIHEQVTGVERAPGMTVAPALGAESVSAWWSARVGLPDDETARRRTTTASGVGRSGPSSLIDPADDANEARTTMMPAVEPAIEPVVDPAAMRRTGEHDVVDDGSRTMIMESLGPDVLGADVLGADTPDADAPGADTPGADLGTDGDAEPVDDDADARDPGATIPDGSPVQPAPRGRKKRKSRR